MRDTSKVGENGQGKSLGYGFVSFSEHQHAVEALRAVNNNPDYFGSNKVSRQFLDNSPRTIPSRNLESA